MKKGAINKLKEAKIKTSTVIQKNGYIFRKLSATTVNMSSISIQRILCHLVFVFALCLLCLVFKGAYWIIQRFLVHYQILHLSIIAIAILDFSLLLPIKLSLFQLFLCRTSFLSPFFTPSPFSLFFILLCPFSSLFHYLMSLFFLAL